MNYLCQLTEDEVLYICSVVPLRDSISYFQRNPKEFAKIMPGFRAKSLKDHEQVSALLFRSRNHNFISSFIEKHISDWLSQIQEHIAKMMEDGDSKESAHLRTLPFCFFADSVSLYFKLINEEHTEEHMALLSAAVNVIKEASDQQDKIKHELKVKESKIGELQSKLNLEKLKLERTTSKLNESNIEIKELKSKITSLENKKSTMQKVSEMATALEAKILMREETINGLRKELAEAKNNNQQLDARIRSEIEKYQTARAFEQKAAPNPKCPCDIEEFQDFLGYNLENIGVPADSEYYILLKEHLSKVLFQGIPIIVNRGVGINLIKCISNALIGRSNVKMLAYSKDLSIDDVNCFLSSAGRVVCLDNFIGNYNETELLPLFDGHKNKIIFLTVAYDRTIHYVSREFLRYCQYLNFNRVVALSVNVELTEDPSTVEEVDWEPQGIPRENRYASLLREIVGEIGILQGLVESKCTAISDEQDLCRILAFDILPYCVDVLQIAPYNTSERLNKYAGDAGRCPYKKLLKGWFVR